MPPSAAARPLAAPTSAKTAEHRGPALAPEQQPAATPATEAGPVQERPVSLPRPHGALSGRLFQVAQPQLAVVIAAATGVPAAYYAAFARWLAQERDAAVLIFDYSDFASSAQSATGVRASAASMRRWGVDDAEAARRWLHDSFADLPLWHIGHSLGAVAFPFQSRLDQVSRFISVCGGPVHWRDHPWPMRGKAWALWHLLGPASIALRGHFPGQWFGLGAPLPRGVFWQWRRWCTTPGACGADPAMPRPQTAEFRAPVTLIAVEDDEILPAEVAWKTAAWLPEASITRRLLHPADHGARSIGHIAAFAPRNSAFWPQIIA